MFTLFSGFVILKKWISVCPEAVVGTGEKGKKNEAEIADSINFTVDDVLYSKLLVPCECLGTFLL